MKLRAFIIAFLIFLICATQLLPVTVFAGYYGTYTDVATLDNENNCYSTQGFAVGSTYTYSAKINDSQTEAIIYRTNMSNGSTTLMTNGDDGTTYCDYLGHANDIVLSTINSEYYMFIVTLDAGNMSLVKLRYSGTTYYKVGNFSIQYNSIDKAMSGVAITSKDANNINFLFKSGLNFYKGSIGLTANSGIINVTDAFTLNIVDAQVNGGTVSDILLYLTQGFCYDNDKLYFPLTYENNSIVLVYDNISAASGTIYASDNLSFRITSSTYSYVFEIEGCGIASDGKLWFNSNRKTDSSDVAHDAVCYFNNYNASVSAEYYNTYTDSALLDNANECYSAQGFSTGSTYVYSAKANSDYTKAVIYRTNINDGTTTLMTNGDNSTNYCTYLGHANDMENTTINSEYYIFVVTTSTDSLNLVKLRYSGTSYYKVGNFSIKYNGSDLAMSGIEITSKDANNIYFLFKSGQNFYKGSIGLTANSGTINVTSAFNIDIANALVYGSTVPNITSYSIQDFCYYNDKIYLPLTYQNVSIILVYDNISAASGTIYSSNDLSFRITSSTYSNLFEIQGCGIVNGDKLWFNCNRKTDSNDVAHDGVCYFNCYSAS